MRILALTNIPGLSVGYGSIAKNLFPMLSKEHEVALLSNYGIMGYQETYLKDYPIKVYGGGYTGFDESIIPNVYQDFKANCLFTVYDNWAAPNWDDICLQNRIPMVCYVPVDTDIMNIYFLEALKHVFKIIPMSRHSEILFTEAFPDKTLPCIPVSIESTFRRLWTNQQEKCTLKRNLGFAEDTFLIGLAGDIKYYRKSWAENVEGIKIFRDRHPEIKLGIYIHTNISKISGVDFNVQNLVDKFKLLDITRFTEQYKYLKGVNSEELNTIYNSLDVYCCASRGEGGGMMFLEAQAAGTPVIATDYTGMPEVVRNGYLVKPIFCQMEQALVRKAIPDPQDIANGLEKIYYNQNRERDCQDGIEFAQQFQWEKTIPKYWLPAFKVIEQDISKLCFQPPEPSLELQERAKDIKIIS